MRILSTEQGQFKTLDSYLGKKKNSPIPEQKSLLRAKLKEQRALLSIKEENKLCWGPIQVERFFKAMNIWPQATRSKPPEYLVTSYLPLPGEFDCRLQAQPWWLFPKAGKNSELRWFSGDEDSSNLVEGKFGIIEAREEKTQLLDKSKTIYCFVPALGVDKMGIRLGFGGGYFDKLLADYKNIISVICTTEDFIFENLPTEAHDMPVNYVVTPTAIWKTNP